MTQDNFDATKIDYRSALYFLKILYDKVLKITDIAVAGLILPNSPLLNHYYITTIFLIDKLLKRSDFKTLGDGTKYLFPTLMGYADIDTEWNMGRSNAYAFLAKIEGKWLEVGKPIFLLPTDLQKVFNDMDNALLEYEKQRKNEEKIYTELKETDVNNLTEQKVSGFLHLDKDGNFWVEPKDKFCYSMGAKSARYKILSYLVDNKGYQDTKSISNVVKDDNNTQGIRTELFKIKKNIKNCLDIDDIIQSKKGSGYRINPTYKVLRAKKQ